MLACGIGISPLFWDSQPLLFKYSAASDSISGLGGTFTRASTASYRANTLSMLTASSGSARSSHYEFDPVTSQYKPALLLEGQRTNICLQSEDFGTTWTTAQATVSTNQAIAPTGNPTADKIQEDASTNSHQVSQSIGVSTSTVYTHSVFLKAGERSVVWLRAFAAGSSIMANCCVDLSTGTISSQAPANCARIEAWTGSWWRVSITFTSDASASAVSFDLFPCIGAVTVATGATQPTPTGNWTYTGTAGSGFYAWGAQTELGAFQSSYIATTTATVTRAADSLNFPISFTPQPLTVYMRLIPLHPGDNSIPAVPWTLGSFSSAGWMDMDMPAGVARNSANDGSSAFGPGLAFLPRELLEVRSTYSGASLIANLSRNGGAESADSAVNKTLSSFGVQSLWLVRSNLSGPYSYTVRDVIIARGIKPLSYFSSLISP